MQGHFPESQAMAAVILEYDAADRELASRIYVELVKGTVSPDGAKTAADPAVLAKVSFKLAKAFQRVQNELNAENLPKNQDFKVGTDDIAGWITK